MDQNEVRKMLLNFLLEKGVTQLYICKRIGMPTYILSRFKSGTKDLYEEDVKKLYKFLTEYK